MAQQEIKEIESLKAKVILLEKICRELEVENSELKHNLEVVKAMYQDAKNRSESFDRIMRSQNPTEAVAFYMTNYPMLNDMQLQDLMISFPEISSFIITEYFDLRSVNIMLDRCLYQGFANLSAAKICDFIRQLKKNNIKTFSFSALFNARELDEYLGKALTQLMLEETIDFPEWFYHEAYNKEWFKPFAAEFRKKYKEMVEEHDELYCYDNDNMQG